MNIVDIVILVLFIPAIIRGIMKGFVQQAAALAGLVLSIWAAFRFSEPVYQWLTPYIEASEGVLHVVAFAVILIVVIIVTALIGRLLAKVLKFALLGWLDKLLGIVFALLVAFLLIGIVIVLMDSFNARFGLLNNDMFTGSVLYNGIKDIMYKVFPYLKDLLVTTAQ